MSSELQTTLTFCHHAFTTPVPFGTAPEISSPFSSALTHAANAVGLGLLSAQLACTFSVTNVVVKVASLLEVHCAVSPFSEDPAVVMPVSFVIVIDMYEKFCLVCESSQTAGYSTEHRGKTEGTHHKRKVQKIRNKIR